MKDEQELNRENYKILLRNILKYFKKLGAILFSQFGRINILKMSVLPN